MGVGITLTRYPPTGPAVADPFGEGEGEGVEDELGQITPTMPPLQV